MLEDDGKNEKILKLYDLSNISMVIKSTGSFKPERIQGEFPPVCYSRFVIGTSRKVAG
jgi:hypothetical protein